MIDAKQLGLIGENKAAEYLVNHGFQLLHRNYTSPFGEMDLVMRKGSEFVFVEVKTRSGQDFGEPYLAVSESKKKKYRNLALFYIQRECTSEPAYRFDIISLIINRWNGDIVRLDHYDNAFV